MLRVIISLPLQDHDYIRVQTARRLLGYLLLFLLEHAACGTERTDEGGRMLGSVLLRPGLKLRLASRLRLGMGGSVLVATPDSVHPTFRLGIRLRLRLKLRHRQAQA